MQTNDRTQQSLSLPRDLPVMRKKEYDGIFQSHCSVESLLSLAHPSVNYLIINSRLLKT